ncbi:MAG TPA: carboxypeptidase regulatory-like domain-containing protein [Candidatus Angelobacter sp.]|nr:carboxypeptidase regulatory-like domain-containing protein [Candidatus Angelobacter sp.]
MKSILLAVAVLLAACLFPGNYTTKAQGVGASADLTGTVTDPTGAEVPNAKVTVTDTVKGVQRTAMTDEHGFYRASGLAPSTYKVSVEHTGFQTEVSTGVVLTVGQTLVLDFHLKLSGMSSQVEVTSELPIVETERGSQSDTLTQDYISQLPIDRRDYLTFTLLMPGVSNSTRLADDQDFRVKQTPQSGLSFYGSNGRGNSVTVDGGEAQDDAGGVRLTVSQDAVQEFQVNRSNYGADQGSAFGGSINIVTKSGGNDVHGSLFGYFRNDAMDAADPFARSQALLPGGTFSFTGLGKPVKNALSRYQFGGSVGAPIKKDKTFLFLGAEGLRQDSQSAVPLLTDSSIFAGPNPLAASNPFSPTDPRNAQQAIVTALATLPGNPNVPCLNNPNGTITTLPAQTCAGALGLGLTVSPVTGLTAGQNAINNFLINQFETNGGLFNYATREYLVSGRLDHHFSSSNQFVVTYRYGHDLEENPDVQSLTGFSAGSSIHLYDDTLMGAWYHQFSPTLQNELRLQWNYEHFNVIPNEPAEVGLQIFGFANNLGTNIFLPNLTILRRYEIGDNLSLTRGRHTLKFGGAELLRGNHTESHTFMPGRFVFGTLPGAILSPCLLGGNPNPCQLATGGAFMNSLQASSLGLPQVFQQGFGDADYPAYTRPYTSLYFQDSWKMTHNFTLNYGVRYEIDSQFKPLNTYYKDFGPRVSFAWDPFNNHKTVIRGGYGMFFGQIDAQIAQVDLSLGVLNANHTTVENNNGKSGIPGQVDNVVGTCGVGLPGVPIIPGSGGSPCTRYIAIYVDPLPGVPALGLKGAGAVFQTLFAQGKIQCTTPAAGSAACITPTDVAQFGIFVANTGQLSPLTVLFSNPPNYKPPYSQQASIGIEREIAPGFSVSLSGIYSHTLRLPVAIDTNLLKAPITTLTLLSGKTVSYRNWNTSPTTDPAALLPPQLVGGAGVAPCGANPLACFVNPLIVQNNQYTSASSALYEGGILEVKKRFSNSFTLFGNYTYSKAFDTSTDFNSDYGPQDPTNLGADRGLSEFDERHKVVIAGVFDSPWKQNAIVGGFQLAPIFSYHSGHPFNLLAGGEVNGNNHTTNERPIGAGRDTGLGPSYTNFDMRISWQHKVHEKASLLLTAEGFNIANHTNFASVNNEVSPLFGFLPGFTTFHVHGSAALSPSQPLGFTSVFPKRQIQLGLRLTF